MTIEETWEKYHMLHYKVGDLVYIKKLGIFTKIDAIQFIDIDPLKLNKPLLNKPLVKYGIRHELNYLWLEKERLNK